MTRPCRRITLHLSQIGLTLGFTFTAVSVLFSGALFSMPGSQCRGLNAGAGYLYRYTMRPRDRS
ncbi:hypothetical protein LAUMK7_01310 [Mycobacterium kansasii]|uniref:Uncharacterized protein n=1 Tax=Mycobacterium kansasii TaxID=1768 RepID=A0A653EGI7_MYCKA|nr:hypothetical protein MKANGN_40900 [Mycobacterium kansasii]VAZ58899.1 hypothetical protein LAUMK22_00691 [Mycobacterium kansasii]VAZ65294.1 hypothetical protein LAUMK40_01419 [Mycobacterium kansasii]VAZ72376.1 hypothetical protein LAUMK7_01310 [Mycobacterium kansasii]VTO95980.1 hypothetical protein BIN_B_00185 [Mycobacterium kansasii]